MTPLSKLNTNKTDISPNFSLLNDDKSIDQKIIDDIKKKVDQFKNDPTGKDAS